MARSVTVFSSVIATCMLLTAEQTLDSGETLQKREFERVFLAEDSQGQVWLHNLFLPLPHTLRVPTVSSRSNLRLSKVLARELSPLVARIVERTKTNPVPRSRDAKRPIILLHLRAGVRRIDPIEGNRLSSFEVASARIVHAETLHSEFASAWEDLANSLREAVIASLDAPNSEKRDFLVCAIEKGRRALQDLIAARPQCDASAAIDWIRDVAPTAKIVTTFQREVARTWGGTLRRYAECLRLEPSTHFPEAEPNAPLWQVLAECESGRAFGKKIRTELGDAWMEERLFGSYPLGASLHVWEVEHLDEASFEKARMAAEKEWTRKKRVKKEMHALQGYTTKLPGWGVEVREAGPEILAENLVLKGMHVVNADPGGTKVDLRVGDLILDYTGPEDLQMRQPDLRDLRFTPYSTASCLRERSGSGGTGGALRVIRDRQLITLHTHSRVEERGFNPCYLSVSEDGVWTRELHIHLGMFSSMAYPPRFRLSSDCVRTLEPLLTRFLKGKSYGFTAWWNPPRGDGPISLLRFDGKVRLVDVDWKNRQKTYEIVSVRILSVEFLTPAWMASFEILDDSIRRFVAVSREAPAEAKRKRLADLFRRGLTALETMRQATASKALRERVSRVEPKARIVHELTRRIAREWGDCLQTCSKRALGIKMSEPPERERIPPLDILVGSASPGEFVSKMREEHGEDGLEDRLYWSSMLGRVVVPWEFEEMTQERFSSLRTEAVKAVADREAWEEKSRKQREKTGAEPEVWDMPAWGVKLRRATAEDLARVCLIRGTKVVELLPAGSPIGLQRADIVIEYDDIYDIVMGGARFASARRILERIPAGSKLRVIRGDRLVRLEVPKDSNCR